MTIVRSVCNHCFQRFELRLNREVDGLLLSQISTDGTLCDCPRHCGGKINLVNDEALDALQAPLKPPLVLGALELYQALNGMPLPDEVPKDRVTIRSLLRSSSVKDAVVEEHNGRFYLHEIVMEEGVVLHLAAGGRGAQVFKITKEGTDAV